MWKKIRNSKIYVAGLVVIVIFIGFAQVSKASYFSPGSQEDPIVTQSYVEKRNEQLKVYVDQKIEEISKKIGGVKSPGKETQGTAVFEVIEIQQGEKLICGASTEIILRSGQAVAIASDAGGVSDLIAGVDLSDNEAVPANHLLLIPRDDGRGIKSITDRTFVLIKGEYEIR